LSTQNSIPFVCGLVLAAAVGGCGENVTKSKQDDAHNSLAELGHSMNLISINTQTGNDYILKHLPQMVGEMIRHEIRTSSVDSAEAYVNQWCEITDENDLRIEPGQARPPASDRILGSSPENCIETLTAAAAVCLRERIAHDIEMEKEPPKGYLKNTTPYDMEGCLSRTLSLSEDSEIDFEIFVDDKNDILNIWLAGHMAGAYPTYNDEDGMKTVTIPWENSPNYGVEYCNNVAAMGIPFTHCIGEINSGYFECLSPEKRTQDWAACMSEQIPACRITTPGYLLPQYCD